MTIVLLDKVPSEHIEALIASLDFEFARIGETTTTVCYAYLPNGFRVGHGDSACVDPDNFNFEEGCHWAKQRAIADARMNLWQVEGYLLKVTGQISSGDFEHSTAPVANAKHPQFVDYQSKPIVRTAYEVQDHDVIHALDAPKEGAAKSVMTIGGVDYRFAHYEAVKPGDFIVFLDETDIYHVRREVMAERNHLE